MCHPLIWVEGTGEGRGRKNDTWVDSKGRQIPAQFKEEDNYNYSYLTIE